MGKKTTIFSIDLSVATLLVFAITIPHQSFSRPEGALATQIRHTTAALSPAPATVDFSSVENAKLSAPNYKRQDNDTPAKLNNYIRIVTKNISKDIDAGRTEEVSRQASSIMQAASDLSPRNMEYPVACKFIVPTLCHTYTEAVRLIQEGARNKDRAKMRLGLEKLEQANNSGAWKTIEQAQGKGQTTQTTQ